MFHRLQCAVRLLAGVAVIAALTPIVPALAAERLNVLLIMADDLRPDLASYGGPAQTPNLDALARRGIQFNRAYCQQALCNPSRSSMLTGRRPDSLGLWCNGVHFRELAPDVVTLPQHFKANGYVTRDVGKIFHNWHTKEKGDRRSWSADEFLHYENHGNDKPLVAGRLGENRATAPKCERISVPDDSYFDGRVAAEAVRVLNEIKNQPFFLAVGFWKPHAPFNAPAKYWDLYDPAILPPLDPDRPAGAPELAFHDGRELRGLPPNQLTFTPQQAAEMRHGYLAGISYLDAQVGKVLSALAKNGLTERTVIVFCGDHGYHLGEQGLWAKTSCYELDAHVPLLIVPPKLSQAGKKSDALVELLDLYPTLIDLCGLPAPAGLEGTTLRKLLDDPAAAVKSAAFTQHPRPAYYDRTEKGVPDAMGYSVRTAKARYTQWRDWQTGKLLAAELYDHTSDPREMTNLIDSPAAEPLLAEARRLLHQQFPPDKIPAKR
ncbi:MAG: sulfatase [Planctomycetaceae bacterium]|nr:sulfatase [Planctomycetaceae bacterium]